MKRGTLDMADVMDRLITEHRGIWNFPKSVECPYCRDKKTESILKGDEVEIYISMGSLWVVSSDYSIFEFKDINYCPMCRRSLK